MRCPAQLTSSHRHQLSLVAEAVLSGKSLCLACRQYRVPDAVARQWRKEMGINPRLTAPLKSEDVQAAATRWLARNADKRVSAQLS